MKRIVVLLVLLLPLAASAQVVNFAKTLPVRAISVGAAPVYNTGNVYFDQGMGYYIHAGYGIDYQVDVNFKYTHYPMSKDYIGVDLQYLFHESRQTYFSVISGLHRWDEIGFDLTGLYTYMVRYWINFSAGLDIDVEFNEEIDRRFWIPVNVGFNAGEWLFVYLEYNLPANEQAWDMVAVGANFIIR